MQGLLRILIRRMEGDEDLKIPKWLNILLIVLAIAYLVVKLFSWSDPFTTRFPLK